MRLVFLLLALLSGCATQVLVSSSASHFPHGYATISTIEKIPASGKACHAGTITYYKGWDGAEHWISEANPYFAAPGTYRIALSCQSEVSAATGECQDLVSIDYGGAEINITVAPERSYVLYCVNGIAKFEDRASSELLRSHQQ